MPTAAATAPDDLRFRAADVCCQTPAPEVCAGVGVGEDGGLRLALRGSPTLRRWRLRCARGGGG